LVFSFSASGFNPAKCNLARKLVTSIFSATDQGNRLVERDHRSQQIANLEVR